MTFHVAVARVALRIPTSTSLKEKRMVVRSTTAKIRNHFTNAAVAEVETLDAIRLATLGIACVSGEARHAEEMLAKVLDFVNHERLDAIVDVVDSEIQAF